MSVFDVIETIKRLETENKELKKLLNGAHPSFMKRLWTCKTNTCIVRLHEDGAGIGFAHYETIHGEKSNLLGGLPLNE